MIVVNLGFVVVFQMFFCCLRYIITTNDMIRIMWVWGWWFGVKGIYFIFIFLFVIDSFHCLILVFFVGLLVVGCLQWCLLYCWRRWLIILLLYHCLYRCSRFMIFVIIVAVIVMVCRSEVSIYFFVTVKVIHLFRCLNFPIVYIFFIALVLTPFIFSSLLLFT